MITLHFHLQPQYKYELFQIYFTSFHCTGRYELNKLTSLPMCGFIAQLVEHRKGIAEVTGSNPAEALILFRLLLSNCLNWKIYCHDHSSLLIMTPVRKDGSVRACGDFKVTINSQLEVNQYSLPRIDDIYASLGWGTLFSFLNLGHDYLQMEAEEHSRPFLTITQSAVCTSTSVFLMGWLRYQPSGSGPWIRSCKGYQGFSATWMISL